MSIAVESFAEPFLMAVTRFIVMIKFNSKVHRALDT